MKLSQQVLQVALALLLVFAITSAQETTPSDITTPATAIENNSTYPNGIINRLISPLRQRFSSARTFFSSQLGNVRNITEQQIFGIFMRLYNKTYSVEELPRRMAIFLRRRKMIQDSVQAFMEGKLPFAMKENRFTDWDEDELKKLTGVSLPPLNELDSYEIESSNNSTDDNEANFSVQAEKIPASKDWRTSGCVSTPINQMSCGACYAIATMSVVESMKCLTASTSPRLSPQQIVDCASSRQGYANYGCDGGWPTRVLKYLQDKNVVSREICYPFVRRQQFCKLDTVSKTTGCSMQAGISGNKVNFKVLHNENDVLYHVAKTGPVVTVMKASDKFLFYGGKGIFDDPSCSNRRDDVDHAIVITGYGKENNVDYWLIKNSWGVDEWGEQGYAKYRRGKNACSIGHWGWVVT